MKNDEILTIKEVAAYLKLNEKTAYRLVLNGEIPGFKVGGSWRFRERDIRNWVNEQTEIKKKPNGKRGNG